MDEFTFKPIPTIGNERRSSTEIALGLESLKHEIANKGMSRDMFHRVEDLMPGALTSAGIDPRKLTANPSNTSRQVAVEAIDVASAAAGIGSTIMGGGVAGAATAVASVGVLAGVGYLMYKFYKWIKSKWGTSSKEGSDPKPESTPSEASENYSTMQGSRSLPESGELKDYYEEFIKSEKDPSKTAIARSVIHHCDKNQLNASAARALVTRCLDFITLGDGANVLVEYLLTHKDGIHPHWNINTLIGKTEIEAAKAYTEWVAKLVPLVTEPIADGKTLEQRVSALIAVYQAQGLSTNITKMSGEEQGGYISRILKFFSGMVKNIRSSTLEQIVNQAAEAHVSEAVKNTVDNYKATTCSIYQDIPGSGLPTTTLAISKQQFGEMLKLYQNSDGYRVQLASGITAINQIWSSIHTALGKEVVTEEDAKAMSKITNLDDSKGVDLQYSALSQAAYKHIGFALKFKSTLNYISKEIGQVSKTFIDFMG